MTPTEISRVEEREITERLGYYIPPYRVSELMRIAQKITETLTRSTLCMTYKESRLVLEIVRCALDAATEKGE